MGCHSTLYKASKQLLQTCKASKRLYLEPSKSYCTASKGLSFGGRTPLPLYV